MANEPITASEAADLDKMCQTAKDTYVGSVIRSLAVETTVAASFTSTSSQLSQRVNVTVVGSLENNGGTREFPVFVVPVGGCSIVDISIYPGVAVTANATNKWTVNAYTASTSIIAAAASTANTAMTANTAWDIGALTNVTGMTAGSAVMVAFTAAASVVGIAATAVKVDYALTVG